MEIPIPRDLRHEKVKPKFLYLLKTSGKQYFSVFRGYRNGTLVWNGLNMSLPNTACNLRYERKTQFNFVFTTLCRAWRDITTKALKRSSYFWRHCKVMWKDFNHFIVSRELGSGLRFPHQCTIFVHPENVRKPEVFWCFQGV